MKIVDLLLEYAKVRAGGVVSHAFAPVLFSIKQMAGGIVLMLLSAVSFGLTLITLTGTLWCALADHEQWAVAGLWTSIVIALIGAILLIVGLSLFKKPDLHLPR